MLEVKYLIVGAGVSGLGFANFIKCNDYLIIEKEKEAGGFCRTIYEKDFVWDYAGHFFHFADPGLKQFFENKIDKNELIFKEKNTQIYYKGLLIDYPFQKNIHQLPKDEFIDCLYDLFNKDEKQNYDSFEEMLYGKFGLSITNKFLKPYNEKLYACNLNDLDSNAMGRFFPYANIKEIIRNMKIQDENSYNNQFLYPKKGAQTFVKALLQDLYQDKIFYEEELIEVDSINKIATTNKRRIKYNYLVNTGPLVDFMRYENKKLYEENKGVLTYNTVLVFNLGFNKKSSIDNVHWIYIPDEKINFYRVGFYDNILNGDKLSIYVEIGHRSNDDINIEGQLSKALENLREIGIITDHKLEAYSKVVMSPAYVHISTESQQIKESYKEYLIGMNIFSIGRYGDWKYCSIEDSLIDAKILSSQI